MLVTYRLRLLGFELLSLAIENDTEPETAEPPGHVIASNHGGDFGFGGTPTGPYWSPDEPPTVA